MITNAYMCYERRQVSITVMKVSYCHKPGDSQSLAKVRISISIPKEVLEWVDSMVEKRIYANRSHAIEVLIVERMRRGKSAEVTQ